MRLLLLPLLLISFTLSAQEFSDSLLRQSPAGERILHREDTLHQQATQFQTQLDSLPPSQQRLLDSTQVGRYWQARQDSIKQQKQRWQAKGDSLLSPLDTLQQRTEQKVTALKDTLYQKASVQKVMKGVQKLQSVDQVSSGTPAVPGTGKLAEGLPHANLKNQLPTLSVPKVASGLPSLHSPVNAVQQHSATWQQKLGKYRGAFSKHQNKATQYTAPLQQGGKALEQQALQKVPGGELLQKQQQGLEAWKGQQTPDAKAQQAKMQEQLLATAQDHFAHHSQELQAAQSKLQDLKKKYRQVQTDQDVYVKKSSLEGEPLSERLTYGGTMQLLRQPQLAFDLSPLLGYRFNKRFALGVGATYRLALSKDPVRIHTDNAIYGGRVFTEYTLIRSFLLHAEYERMSQVASVTPEETVSRQWQTSLLLGIGKTYRITNRVQGSMLLLYNLRHDQQSIYPRPWMIRLGFHMSGDKQ